MPISAQLQTLLTQLQSRYPTSSVCAELLTVHQGHYVVRATVQIGSMPLATAMAAAPEIETAEDQAKIRVLECLRLSAAIGIPSVPGVPVQPAERFLPQTTPLPPTSFSSSPFEPLPEPAHQTAEPVTLPSLEKPKRPVSLMADIAAPLEAEDATPAEAELPSTILSSSPLPPITPLPAIDLPASEPDVEPPVAAGTARPGKSEKSTRRKSEPAATMVATEPPLTETSPPERTDRSEEVMKIGIEMKRLGWSTEQGREYLKRTYGKRSRQELDDAELLDFLCYLENQPSPMQTPF